MHATSNARLARLAGLLYLSVAVATGIAAGARSGIVVAGNSTATAENIRAASGLFRLNIVADLVSATAFLLTAMALYLLLHNAGRFAAGAMVVFVAASAGIQSLNLVSEVAALATATDPGLRTALGATQSDAMTGLLLDLQHAGFVISQVFFGLWLVPLGYLVIRSGAFPRVLGYLLGAACVAYEIDVLVWFLAPTAEPALLPVVAILGAVGELGFVAWLLVKAVPNRLITVSALA
jgi:hypothetical protein